MASDQCGTRRNSVFTLAGLIYFWRDGLILSQDFNHCFFCVFSVLYINLAKQKPYYFFLQLLILKLKEKQNEQRGIPQWSSDQHLGFSLLQSQIESLVEELRTRKPHVVAKRTKEKNSTPSITFMKFTSCQHTAFISS